MNYNIWWFPLGPTLATLLNFITGQSSVPPRAIQIKFTTKSLLFSDYCFRTIHLPTTMKDAAWTLLWSYGHSHSRCWKLLPKNIMPLSPSGVDKDKASFKKIPQWFYYFIILFNTLQVWYCALNISYRSEFICLPIYGERHAMWQNQLYSLWNYLLLQCIK